MWPLRQGEGGQFMSSLKTKSVLRTACCFGLLPPGHARGCKVEAKGLRPGEDNALGSPKKRPASSVPQRGFQDGFQRGCWHPGKRALPKFEQYKWRLLPSPPGRAIPYAELKKCTRDDGAVALIVACSLALEACPGGRTLERFKVWARNLGLYPLVSLVLLLVRLEV